MYSILLKKKVNLINFIKLLTSILISDTKFIYRESIKIVKLLTYHTKVHISDMMFLLSLYLPFTPIVTKTLI